MTKTLSWLLLLGNFSALYFIIVGKYYYMSFIPGTPLVIVVAILVILGAVALLASLFYIPIRIYKIFRKTAKIDKNFKSLMVLAIIYLVLFNINSIVWISV